MLGFMLSPAFVMPNFSYSAPHHYDHLSHAALLELVELQKKEINDLKNDRLWIKLEVGAVSGACCFLAGYILAKLRTK